MVGSGELQDVPLKSPPLIFKHKIPCKLAPNFLKCQRLHRDFYLEDLGGDTLAEHPALHCSNFCRVLAGKIWGFKEASIGKATAISLLHVIHKIVLIVFS